MDSNEAGLIFTQPKGYADERRFHQACALLRREAPVHRVEADDFNPFYAITKHADVMEIERAGGRWLSAPRPALGPKSTDSKRADIPIRSLVQMDAPDHSAYRHITSSWFQPKALARLEGRLSALAERWVDHMATVGEACDFVTEVAVHYPLSVILSILGLPEEDFPRMLRLTQELFGSADPERGGGKQVDVQETLMDFFTYFQAITDDRRANPTDDLASVIANAEIDGKPIGALEAVGYYVIVATAGHDTTSSSIAGGLHALLEHPAQLTRWMDDPTLGVTAVEEMIRWVSPVKQFMRTATEDSTIRGVPIAAGDSVLLSYPSANRDEEVFERADSFDVGRDPNRHLAFGFGSHYCLGAQLARMEARALFAELLPRLQTIELAGEPSYTETLFVGGPKHLPIRYRFS